LVLDRNWAGGLQLTVEYWIGPDQFTLDRAFSISKATEIINNGQQTAFNNDSDGNLHVEQLVYYISSQ